MYVVGKLGQVNEQSRLCETFDQAVDIAGELEHAHFRESGTDDYVPFAIHGYIPDDIDAVSDLEAIYYASRVWQSDGAYYS